MRKVLSGLLFLTFLVLCLCQSFGSLSGPALGFVFDSSAGIVRPILGISGSARVGEPIDVGLPVTNIFSLPDQRNILAVPESGPFLFLIDLGVIISCIALPLATAH
jgi:hypothetical protein